jgi:hypothetical protein
LIDGKHHVGLVGQRRFQMSIILMFAGAACSANVGIYGVVAYRWLSARTKWDPDGARQSE